MPHSQVLAPGHDRDRSLGWLAVQWMEHFLQHGPGDIQGQPVQLGDELAGFTADVYALDQSGQRMYDSAFFSRPKGADKSSHSARFACFEALGPSRFAGWAHGGEVYEWMGFRYVYEPGEPMGRPVTAPFLRILATEESQASNVFDHVYFNLREGPLREAFQRADDVGLTRVYLPGGGEIRPSTASSAAKDGGRETWCSFDETHLYLLPELHRMYSTVRRNLAKRRAAEPWSFETSTMYEPGRGSVAEQSHELALSIREGKVRLPRFLFDHREAPAETELADEESLRRGLADAYGDAAAYMPIDRIVAEAWDPRTDPTDVRRYFLNQATSAVDAWLRPDEWDRLADPDHQVAAKALITLGFDGSKTDDHTALMACEVDTGHLWPLGIWDPEQFGGEVPRVVIDGSVIKAFADFDVVGFYSDVHPWESYVDRWEQDYGEQLCARASTRHPIAWDMRGRTFDTTKLIEAFHAAVVEGDLSHDGDLTLASHVYNARRRPNAYGVTIGKEAARSPRKIDAAVAAALARKARQDYLALPENLRRRKPTWSGIRL